MKPEKYAGGGGEVGRWGGGGVSCNGLALCIEGRYCENQGFVFYRLCRKVCVTVDFGLKS